jgi:hypothetical protein
MARLVEDRWYRGSTNDIMALIFTFEDIRAMVKTNKSELSWITSTYQSFNDKKFMQARLFKQRIEANLKIVMSKSRT